ncbi:MAG TPA: phosphotransferase [Thermomicrobiales bacterium]|nr:phosphotransferase [Thermomicrobiales bacterium]
MPASDRPHEERLAGGFINEVVRVGDTVRRSGSLNTEFVAPLLQHLDECGWSGAPRFLGIDEHGREILSFIEGVVPVDEDIPPSFSTDETLTALARMVREFHDLTAGTPLAGTEEVVCHNDLSPKNTVYRDDAGIMMPVALIDWDLAAPRGRIYDVGHICWKYLNLGPSVTDLDECARKIHLICDAYGIEDLSGVIDAIIWWQEASIWGIETGAKAGDKGMMRLQSAGVLLEIRASVTWVQKHRTALEQ